MGVDVMLWQLHSALMGIRLETGANPDEVTSKLLAIPGVTNVVMVAGRYDFFVHYVCRNMEEYRQFVVERFRKIPGIANIESFIGLDLYERKFELGVIGNLTKTRRITMREESRKTVVNSWNEWDPLKHVILGRADGTMIQAPETAVQRDWPEDGFPLGTYGPYPKKMQEKANEQLDNFAKILESRGIRVDRPTPIDFGQTVQTPDWVQETMFGCAPIRDILLTVGNEILEATMSYRSRWFEFLCYRPLFEQYFKEDPNFRFEAAPKPRLTERSYKKDWWKEWNSLSEEEQYERAEKGDWILTEVEPLFDAADVVRFGKDLIVQKSMVTNDAGIDWLRRHFSDHRIHKVGRRELLPWHLDSTLVPLRPGFALVNPTRPPLGKKEREFFEKNDWELVETPKTVLEKKRPYDFCSWWLNMNTLVLDPKTICVEASETPVMELLDKHGFEVVPVPFYEVSPFGGGLHCCTADVYREGTCEDYFPKQIEGF